MEGDPTLYIGAPDPLRDHPRYSTLRLLSQGSCGVVNLAYDTVDRDYVAVKLIERSVSPSASSRWLTGQRPRQGAPGACCHKVVAAEETYLLQRNSLANESAFSHCIIQIVVHFSRLEVLKPLQI